ncbi:conserved hypothetical protein [Pediculus humanus corporis]|uniref:CCDC174 alpha/beta GRSR domain-containing protein n=1 Tax=Pediculus humanus subsp. corporis TaxID=121224 RepID=E0W3Z9_PEDHC|nr:uncharacterized protein Phum_PHUM613180 [Pediculus humanus corporis]EEB20355.1 conserved hypothetical protein [Pediculus humanus corporis]
MSTSKKIEINQSSLLGLKAEVLRKKNEIHSAKYAQEVITQPTRKKLTTKFDKINEGVDERNKRDAEEIQEEAEEIKKSQKILEAKSKLYEKLINNPKSVEKSVDVTGFLVDFKQKCEENTEPVKIENDESSNDCSYSNYSDEEDWVDFVDCLGRTKRCHKDDLSAMKEQDEKLKQSLHGDKPKEKENSKEFQLPQLCSEDMKREILRQKWEEQERNLLDKKNIHYQDVLFDVPFLALVKCIFLKTQ